MGVDYFNVFFCIKRGIYEDHRIASVLSKTSIGYVLKPKVMTRMRENMTVCVGIQATRAHRGLWFLGCRSNDGQGRIPRQ
jgi:hypothetical protein